MVEDQEDPAAKARRELLDRVYALILSWPDPKDNTSSIPDYCTQNDRDCATCPLSNGELVDALIWLR
jgi:hypothetical protein